MPRKSKYYLKNKDLVKELKIHRETCKFDDEGNYIKGSGTVHEDLAIMFFDIAKNFATKPNFSGYSYKEDMIMDGIENCLLYINNFDHEKSSNPFAYFTQVIWFAFLRRIAKEKKQLYVKYKSSHQTIAMSGTFDGGEDLSMHLNTNADYINTFIEDYEEKLGKNKKKDDTDNTERDE